MLGVERPDAVGTRVCRMTDPLLGPFKRIVPALIYRIERAPE